MDTLIRELQRMSHRLDAIEEHRRGVRNTPRTDPRHHSQQKMYSDKEPKPTRFRVTSKKRILLSQQHDFKIDLSEFDGSMDLDEFVDWLQTVEKIIEYKDIPLDRKASFMPQH